MQSDVQGILIHAELQHAEKRVNQSTGEVTDIKDGGNLYLLVVENGEPLVKRVKCTMAAATSLLAEGKAFLKRNKPDTYPLDNREYDINGRKGFSLTLVEEGSTRRQRASFSLEDDPFEDVKTSSESLKPAANGTSPVGNVNREPATTR